MARLPYVFAFLFVLFLSQAAGQNEPAQSIYNTLLQSDNYTIFTELVSFVGLNDTLQNDQNLTVFAPQDTAFYEVPRWFARMVLTEQGRPFVKAFVSYLIANNTIASNQVPTDGSPLEVPSIIALNLTLTSDQTDNGDITVNQEATIVEPDIQASNGVIHGIDDLVSFTYPLFQLQFNDIMGFLNKVRRSPPVYVIPVPGRPQPPQPTETETTTTATQPTEIATATATATAQPPEQTPPPEQQPPVVSPTVTVPTGQPPQPILTPQAQPQQ